MKRVVVVVALAAALGTACKRDPETTSGPLRHPLLWSVEKDGNTTYFLGTMHVGIDAENQLPPAVWSKLHDARAFAMEADLDEARIASLIKPTERSLQADLGDAYWHKLEDALGSETARALDHLPALVPAGVLSARGLPVTEAMDKVLARHATREHKPIVFLEPAERQIAIAVKWMNVKALEVMLDDLPQTEQQARETLAAYVAGDEQRILAITSTAKDSALRAGYSAADYEQQMNELNYDRNASWIAALEQLHAGGGGFVAVGALHLVGPRSVLDLLARKGYQVTRIAVAPRPAPSCAR